MRTSKRKPRRASSTTASPVKQLKSELADLRSDLRKTVRAYTARLEIELARSLAALEASKPAEQLPRERLHELRDLTILVRKRKLKPEKGRRKDLRKIDSLIEELQLLVQSKIESR